MDAIFIQKSIEQLKTSTFNQLHHSTLLKYTDDPPLNDYQLFYLILPLLNNENWDDHINTSAITVAMVHASLSEHEKINETNATSKEQQLTVLSGDYYSGRYYQLLAKTGNISLIREISRSIVNRCEQQIKFYESNKLSVQQWLESILKIETVLISKFYTFYKFDKYTAIMTKCLLILKLYDELSNYENGHMTTFINKINTNLESSVTFDQVIGQEVDKLYTELTEYLQSSKLLKDEVKLYIMNQLALGRK